MKPQRIETKIFELRGIKVMLDSDLAELYEVETKNLNLAVKRNISRFPKDFMFKLSKAEWDSLRLQIETSNGRGGKRYTPNAFTEQGVSMLSSILRSQKAIKVNIGIMRAFVMMRQYALTNKELTIKIKELESRYNKKFKNVYEAIDYLLKKDKQEKEQTERKRIGYKRE